MKGDSRHVERDIQMLMVYLRGLSKIEFPFSQWRRTNADASYQTWIFTYLSNPAIKAALVFVNESQARDECFTEV